MTWLIGAMLLAVPGVTQAAEVPPPPAASVAAPVAPAVVAAPRDLNNEIVCHSTIETGSLIGRHKTCLTRKQWVTLNDANQGSARRMIENNPGGFRSQ